MSNFEDR